MSLTRPPFAAHRFVPDPSLCTEDDIRLMVHRFYDRVRADAVLGPVFERHVDDWPVHLERLVDFWSSVLRGTARFAGSPMQKHAALPELDQALFARWLSLFRETLADHPNQPMAQRAIATAERIAQSLWMGWQFARDPDTPARPLPPG